MTSLADHLSAYYQHHQKSANRMAHYVGLPLLILAALIFLGWIHLGVPNVMNTNFAWLASLALVIYYFFIDWQFALATFVGLFAMNFIASFISQPAPSLFGVITFFVCAITGLILIFIGHYLEGDHAELKTLAKLGLSAPLFLVAEIFFALGIRPELKAQVAK